MLSNLRQIHTLTHDGWRMTAGWRMTVRLTLDGSLDGWGFAWRKARFIQFACLKMRVVLRRECDNWANTVLYVIVRTGPKVALAQKCRTLLYSDLVRQTNRHASSEPSCVNQPSCVNRHASKYESALITIQAAYKLYTFTVHIQCYCLHAS